jgi:glycosyltransferase involved in cell wall biosynthesis
VADRIRWLGARADAERLYPALDLLLLPSLWEGLPYVLLEALADGVPVLATPAGGVPEVLRGPVLGRGCLEWDVHAWAERARALVASRRSWEEAAIERARAFPEERTVEAVASLYRDLLAARLGAGSPLSPAGRDC